MIDKDGYSGLNYIRLDGFEGPYDLLLTLIEKNKMNIMDIRISLIADQYLDILSVNFDMEIAGEFLYMASVLLHMKSGSLLPKPQKEEEEMSEDELRRRLLLYKKYKEIAPELADKMEQWKGAYYRMPEKIDFPKRYMPVEISSERLAGYYAEIVEKNRAKKNDNTSKMERILTVEKVSLKEKMHQVIQNVIQKTRAKFSELFAAGRDTKLEVVTGFLAVLELNRRKKIHLQQNEIFGEIVILRGEDALDINDYDENEEYD